VGSPVGRKGLWWEGFVEQVSFKSGVEERGSDGWCDGANRWWTRLTELSRKIIPQTCDAYWNERSVILREEDMMLFSADIVHFLMILFFSLLVIGSIYNSIQNFRCLDALAWPRHITRGRGEDTTVWGRGSENCTSRLPGGEAVPRGTTTLVNSLQKLWWVDSVMSWLASYQPDWLVHQHWPPADPGTVRPYQWDLAPAVEDFYHTKMAHILVSVYSVFFLSHSAFKPITINNIHINVCVYHWPSIYTYNHLLWCFPSKVQFLAPSVFITYCTPSDHLFHFR